MAESKPKTKSNKKKTNLSPGIEAVTYKGPTRLPKTIQANDVITTQLNNQGTISTSAGGLINTVFDSMSQLAACQDYASFQNTYTEYRILSMDIEFVPWNKYNQGLGPGVNLAPVYVVEERDTATAIPNIATAIAYLTVQIIEPSKRFRKVIKMNDIGEAQFLPSGTSVATTDRMYVKLYSIGNGVSIPVYDFIVRIMVQWRGRS